MTMNALDKGLSDSYKKHGGRMKAWKHLGGNVVGSLKDAISKGSKSVGEYFSKKLKNK